MKNIVEKIIILLFILVTFNNNAEGLLVIKKSKFTNCNDILYHGDYKGNGEYILYDENQEPYTINCEVEQKIFEQKNYLGLSIEELNKIPEMNLEKIKIYHSEDLYFVFNKKEIEYCLQFNDPYPHFAGKFAVKEAVIKSIKDKIKLSDIKTEIIDSKPTIKLTNKYSKKYYFKISISHEKNVAIGIAISEKNN